LFEQIKGDIVEARLTDRLWGLFVELLNILAELFDAVDEADVFSRIINNDQSMKRIARLLQPTTNQQNAA
jgi:hypothetical protein